MSLPPYVPWEVVAQRLPLIFPEGTPNRVYCTRIYIGAVDGMEVIFQPKQAYRMTDKQSVRKEESARREYVAALKKRRGVIPGKRWYEDNTREPIRDETLQNGLVLVGAVTLDQSVGTTANRPRYTLKKGFAALFDPALEGAALDNATKRWRADNLTPGSLMRTQLAVAGLATAGDRVLVRYPNGEARQLSPGESANITKAVVEVFAPKFLTTPAVLWLSESSKKVITRDETLAGRVGLSIAATGLLPDLILVDLGPSEPLIVFVEVVHSDGAISDRRQEALWKLTDQARFDRKRIAFVTAYNDRDSPGFRKTLTGLAWRSFAWFVSEPQQILIMRDGVTSPPKLADLMGE